MKDLKKYRIKRKDFVSHPHPFQYEVERKVWGLFWKPLTRGISGIDGVVRVPQSVDTLKEAVLLIQDDISERNPIVVDRAGWEDIYLSIDRWGDLDAARRSKDSDQAVQPEQGTKREAA